MSQELDAEVESVDSTAAKAEDAVQSKESPVNEFVFNEDDLSLFEFPVRMPHKNYVLRAADGEVARLYKNAKGSLWRMNTATKETSVKGTGDLETFLVSLCLYEAPFDTNGVVTYKKVHIETIKKWKAGVITKLYNKAIEISGLDEDQSLESLKKQRAILDQQIKELEEDSLKNSQPPTTDGFEFQTT